MPELSLLTLNIANPSPERTERQLSWLAAREEDILVLTETKDSTGCRLLADAFSRAGYHVSYRKPENGNYGVMIASRVQARTHDFGDRVGYLASRAAALTLPAPHGPIQVIGAYVPDKIEHSWVGRTGDGYRYDHVHCTTDLAATLVSCDYHHQTRVDRLSDHSAMSVRLAIEPSEPLITSAPTTVGAPPTLF